MGIGNLWLYALVKRFDRFSETEKLGLCEFLLSRCKQDKPGQFMIVSKGEHNETAPKYVVQAEVLEAKAKEGDEAKEMVCG